MRKPVIAPLIIDRKLQGMPFKKGKSGRKNLNYLDWPWSVERDLAVFKEVASPKKVVFLASEYMLKAIPELAARATETAKEVGFEMITVAVGTSPEGILATIPPDADGVYLAPLAQLSAADSDKLLAELTRRQLPTFALAGERAVRKGMLVGRRPQGSLAWIARRLALHTQRILGGQDAGELSVALQLPEQVFINMKTARAIGLSPSWHVLTEAELVAVQRDDVERRVSLAQAVKEALDGNLDIKALEQVVAAGRASVRQARSNLLPQLDLTGNGRLIDKDRAESSFGGAPEVLVNGDLSATQVIYSEGAWAGYTAEKHIQKSRQEQLVQTRWDIAAEVGVAYLSVLRAKTAERIQRDNLKVTRTNLELARIRVDAGSSSRADVYRWEVQIANDRKSVIGASSQRNLAEIDLQRILHRPPEESFATEEVGLPDSSQDGLVQFLGDPQTFKWFRGFMLEEAIARSPEIKQFDAAIAAQKRVLQSSKRSLYSPTLALSASATQRLYRAGAGSEDPMGSTTDGLEWFVGLNLSIPLYSGGGRYAEIDRNNAEVARLTQEREAVRDQIAQRVASQLHVAGASYAGIRLSRDAAEAAKKNYDLIATAYSEGAVRIVELLDAQTALVTAQQVAADSIYSFMIDWINMQRAVGQFQILMSPGDQKDLVDRAKTYITQRKAGRASSPQ